MAHDFYDFRKIDIRVSHSGRLGALRDMASVAPRSTRAPRRVLAASVVSLGLVGGCGSRIVEVLHTTDLEAGSTLDDAGLAIDAGAGAGDASCPPSGCAPVDAGFPGDAAEAGKDAAGSGKLCGGLLGLSCPSGEWCEYDTLTPCGQGDGSGLCHTKPLASECTAPATCPNVCGCDGVTYCDACRSHSVGADVRKNGTCP